MSLEETMEPDNMQETEKKVIHNRLHTSCLSR